MIELPDLNDIERVADWIELSVVHDKKTFSKARLSSLLDQNGEDADEADIDSIINELMKRGGLYGDASPYIVDGKCVRPKKEGRVGPEIIICLIFSIRGVRKKKRENDGTKLFERLSNEAVKYYLNGEAEVIGFPNKKNLENQIKRICLKTCEKMGSRCPMPSDKDKGVDIIAWKPHKDQRPNQVVILLQCAAGVNFEQKQPISLTAWREFINWDAPPLRGIAIPSIPSNEAWLRIRDNFDMIFDRVRIFRAVYNNTFSDKKLRKEMLTWCKNNLK